MIISAVYQYLSSVLVLHHALDLSRDTAVMCFFLIITVLICGRQWLRTWRHIELQRHRQENSRRGRLKKPEHNSDYAAAGMQVCEIPRFVLTWASSRADCGDG